MSYWELETVKVYYDLIKEDKKKYELRAPDKADPHKDYTKVKAGDTVNIIQVADYTFERLQFVPPISCKVISNDIFDDVESVLKQIDYKKLNPLVLNADELASTIYSFPGYIDRINEYGVSLLKLERIRF
jgi:ASC-1-like (ASCH) protein